MKYFAVDENKRDTYRFSSASGDESSTLVLLEGEHKQLVEVFVPFTFYLFIFYGKQELMVNYSLKFIG